MTGEWVTASWEMRHEVGFHASSSDFLKQHKAKPFYGAKVFFYGFCDDESAHMESELVRNGGSQCNEMSDTSITHVVVDDANVATLPSDLMAHKSDAAIVKAEWFWASIQMDACADEKMYAFIDQTDAHMFLSPPPGFHNQATFSPGTPGRSQSGRKRKRRKDAVSQLANLDGMTKRRSSVSELTMLSMSGSFLDTPSPSRGNSGTPLNARSPDPNHLQVPVAADLRASPVKSTMPPGLDSAQSPGVQQALASMDLRNMTPRQQVFHEIVQTEANYFGILKTILDIKKSLEDPQQPGGQILDSIQIKIIFGNLVPIYEVHSRMLTEFYEALKDWRDDFSVGSVYLRYAEDLLKAYPPYINFIEATKDMVTECKKNNRRFFACLKVFQSKQECGRQSLEELMVRPIQRLPSVTLLLNDLLKHTKKEKEHPDIINLDRALSKIKEVLTHINKDKERTEGQVQIFKVFNDIENCPASLISSQRSFTTKLDAIELGGFDELCGKGYELSLFLFSDVLELAKKRSSNKGLGLRSPSTISLSHAGTAGTLGAQAAQTNSSHHNGHKPPLKHINLITLNTVKRIVDVLLPDQDGGGNVFALVVRANSDFKERMYVFQTILSEEHPTKMLFLKQLCRHVANSQFRTDIDILLRQVKAEDLGLDSSDLSVSNFGSRAYRSLHRKVNRAFSFDRTPTMRLKRAVSSMISPMSNSSKENASSQMNITPVSERIRSTPSGAMQSLRLASCTNLMSSLESARSANQTPGSSRRSPRSSQKSSSSSISDIFGSPPAEVMPPPPMPPLHLSATPKKSMTSVGAASPALTSSDSDFRTEHRGFLTPTQCVRRQSFKMKAAAFLGVNKK